MLKFMKRLLMGFLALTFPFLVLLIKDNPGGAFVALIMQATVIGWLPATIWAFREMRKDRQAREEVRKKANK
jgi:multisubunit Na+/H+ antiporter MnhB subunit